MCRLQHVVHSMMSGRCFCINLSPRAIVSRRRLLSSRLYKISRKIKQKRSSNDDRNNVNTSSDSENNNGITNGLPIRTLRYIMPLSRLLRFVSASFLFGSVALMMFERYEASRLVVGYVFAGGVFMSSTTAYLLTFKRGNSLRKKLLRSPQNVYVCTVGLSLSTVLTVVPNFGIFILGLCMHGIFHSMLSIVLSDLQLSSTVSWDGSYARWTRRILCVVASGSIPYLYSKHDSFPVLCSFWSAFVLTTIIITSLWCQTCGITENTGMVDNSETIVEEVSVQASRGSGRSNASSTSSQSSVSRNHRRSRPRRRHRNRDEERNRERAASRSFEYVELIMLARLVRGKDL